MLVKDCCIYCISPAVPTSLSTYLLHQQGAGALGDLPNGNSNSCLPFPKKKFHVPFTAWEQALCDGEMELRSVSLSTLWGWSLLLIAGCPGYRSHSQKADCFGAKYFSQEVTGKGGEVIFQVTWSRPSSGVLITLESRCVHLPARNKVWRQYSCKLFQSTTLSGCANLETGKLWHPVHPCQATSDTTGCIRTIGPCYYCGALSCWLHNETTSLLAWTMWYREQVLLGASLFLPLLSARCRFSTCCLLHSCCFWQAPRRLMALWLEVDVKEGQAVCEQVLPHSVLYHWYFNVFHAKAA